MNKKYLDCIFNGKMNFKIQRTDAEIEDSNIERFLNSFDIIDGQHVKVKELENENHALKLRLEMLKNKE